MTNVKNKELQHWLRENSSGLLHVEIDDKAKYNFVRVKKNETLDLIYCQELPIQVRFKSERKEAFHYVGIYSKQEDSIYDGRTLSKIFTEYLIDTSIHSAQDLLNGLTKKVSSYVTNLLENPDEYPQKNLTDDYYIRKMESYRANALEREARNAYVTGRYPSFNIPYKPDYWTDDTLFAYLMDEDAYVQAEVDHLLEEAGEKILLSFLIRNAVEKRVEEIENAPQHDVHIAKEISEAVGYEIDKSNVKNVNVTILDNNGKTFTVKMKAAAFLTDRPDGFSTRDIPDLNDQRKYCDHMGSSFNAVFVKDIVEVSYRKKVLYKKK